MNIYFKIHIEKLYFFLESLCVCVCVFVHVCTCASMSLWRQEADIRDLLQLLSTLVFEAGSLTLAEACQVGSSDWPANSRFFLSLPLCTGVMSVYCIYILGSNSGPHVYVVVT